MAVLFPKKVPAFSRALGERDDSFDFDTGHLISAEVSVSSYINVNEIIKAFVIGVGFAQCKALKETVDFSKARIVKEVSISLCNHIIMTCSAHKFDGGSLIWLCDTQQSESCYGFGKWIEALFSSFKLEQNTRIYILADVPTSEFQSDWKFIAPFVRILRTPKAASEYSDIKVLEPPNIISGFAAALMSHCVYESLSACVLITYYDNVRASPTDQDIASMISPILKSTDQLYPYILHNHKLPKLSVQNFDQMYI
ncbi:unnamed protein product [Hymenolepis diminuta]|uniref:Proteasome assembly chaperone 1 n=1 Tax=Hymenolepis diminuta TaxID=6216 RepID=A0A0R3SKD9_HYMDI|nr:unnamed protein product [Hymenolepis diminuta]